MLVPSMLLQPLVENCIKHGLSSKVEGGTIRHADAARRSQTAPDGGRRRRRNPGSEAGDAARHGIGVSNVNERLKVLFGNDYRMWIDSQPGRGTRIEIEVPELQTNLAACFMTSIIRGDDS